MAKQFRELVMAYEDCDTIPFLWRYAERFVLVDNIFEQMTGPSALGNLSIIAAQTSAIRWVKHPDQAFIGIDNSGSGEPVENDSDPFCGSPKDPLKNVLAIRKTSLAAISTTSNSIDNSSKKLRGKPGLLDQDGMAQSVFL